MKQPNLVSTSFHADGARRRRAPVLELRFRRWHGRGGWRPDALGRWRPGPPIFVGGPGF